MPIVQKILGIWQKFIRLMTSKVNKYANLSKGLHKYQSFFTLATTFQKNPARIWVMRICEYAYRWHANLWRASTSMVAKLLWWNSRKSVFAATLIF